MKTSHILPLMALLLALTCFGSTLAYLMSRPETVQNHFVSGSVPPEIEETLDGNFKRDVSFVNQGNVDARMRAQVIVSWKNAADQLYPHAPIEGTDYLIQFNSTDWTLKSDGYWYCDADIAPGQHSPVFIESCQKTSTAPVGFDLSVQILVQTLQSSGNPAADVWAGSESGSKGGS